MRFKHWIFAEESLYNTQFLKFQTLFFILIRKFPFRFAPFICWFSKSEISLNISTYTSKNFVKSKILTVMTSLWRNDYVTWQLNDTKLISLWFSTIPLNFTSLSFCLELWAAGTPPPPPPIPRLKAQTEYYTYYIIQITSYHSHRLQSL